MFPELRSLSSFLNIKAIKRPVIIANNMAPIALASPSSHPNTLAVRTIASTFIAGPEYRNAVAGPIPAPLVYIPAKSGNTVHEHTARTVPDTEATE